MGINLKALVISENIKLDDLSGKVLALDAYNIIYQFLSSIRTYDGEPLKDENGNVVSHILGLLTRTSNLIESGIKPVFVFDGEPHPLKESTITYRKMRKLEAMEEWKKALEEGDMKRARSKAQQTSHFTIEMVRECKHVLDLMGIPHVQAPSDGEGQASYMAGKGNVHGTASQDFDCLLYGCPLMIRNISISGRRKLPGRNKYVSVSVQQIALNSSLSALEISREQLIDMAILMGTDFNEGIKGVGPKTALKLLKNHGTLEEVIEEKGYELPHYGAIREIFLDPDVTDDYDLKWSSPRIDDLKELYIGGHQFKEETIAKHLEKLEFGLKKNQQTSLFSF